MSLARIPAGEGLFCVFRYFFIDLIDAKPFISPHKTSLVAHDIKTMLAQAKKQQEKQPHGKQTLKQLAKQNAGLSNIEITEGNIKAFEQTAKKYGIDFALKKDSTETPPRYLVFFKGRDADALTADFKEFSAKKLTQEQKPSIRKALATFREAAKQLKYSHSFSRLIENFTFS